MKRRTLGFAQNDEAHRGSEGRSDGVLQVPGLGSDELLKLFRGEDLGRAELVTCQPYHGQMLDGLHLQEGVEEGRSIAYRSMVRHEDGLMICYEGLKAGCYLFGAGSRIAGQRYRSESHRGFLA